MPDELITSMEMPDMLAPGTVPKCHGQSGEVTSLRLCSYSQTPGRAKNENADKVSACVGGLQFPSKACQVLPLETWHAEKYFERVVWD